VVERSGALDVGARHGVPVPESAAGARDEDLSADENTQNRGNEAKNSLKTNEVGKTTCAKPTHSCARNASNEAKKPGFRCKARQSAGRIQPQVGVAKAPGRYFMGRGESIHERLGRRGTSLPNRALGFHSSKRRLWRL